MTVLEYILYGLISGFTEVLPVSGRIHQVIMMRLFGVDARMPLLDIVVHLGLLLALLVGCASTISRLRRERAISERSRIARTRLRGSKGYYDSRLIKTASILLFIGLMLHITTAGIESNYVYIILFAILNGIFILIPSYMAQGNKDARHMTGFDGVFLGISGALSVLPGVSRSGMIISAAIARGADREQAFHWAVLLCIPAVIALIVLDILSAVVYGLGGISFLVILYCIIAGLFAFMGGYLGILLMRYLGKRTEHTGFAFYSWGVALFSLVLYLLT